jgi:glycerol transport system substrate-binding protein
MMTQSKYNKELLMSRRRLLMAAGASCAAMSLPAVAWATTLQNQQPLDPSQLAAARRWILGEFSPSTLNFDAQKEEMAFFIRAALPFRGQRIRVASEAIPTHVYEQRFLARAFYEITGIQVQHDLLKEGELVQHFHKQSRTGRNLYDAYVNDSDFIGTHFRKNDVVPLSDWMAGDGHQVTLPTLDIDDFIGISFTKGPDGKIYQLPDQQFANLYWFRYDWFQKPELKRDFAARYGYPLGVPVNWKAYEDIADFFTNHVKEIDGKRIYGHMDYGEIGPSLGWRFTDSWLSMAGVGDPGLPNGLPVDEWGIRAEGCHPVGSSVSRGGATNSPAAVYSLRKYLQWLRQFAPQDAINMNFSEAGPVPAQGSIAQQIFWYSAFTPEMLKANSEVMNSDGTAKWRVAPSPHGAYWSQGMKLGYQDCGAWTLPASTPMNNRRAAWLYAQFCTCKSVSLKKTLVGLTPIRKSDLASQAMTDLAPSLGGLVEFYRSPVSSRWTPTGLNVPEYTQLAQLWWTRIGKAVSGKLTPQEAMDELAEAQDQTLARISANGDLMRCEPKLAKPQDAQNWLSKAGAPKPQLADEEGRGQTMDYENLLAAWKHGRVRE